MKHGTGLRSRVFTRLETDSEFRARLNDPRIHKRFWDKILVAPNGCWIWTANQYLGYGRIKVDKKDWTTHRFAYERLVGPVGDGLVIDHLCRVTLCCNPAHLEPVTNAENVRRGLAGTQWSSRTHCLYGHRYDTGNTKIIKRADGRTRRKCHECAKASTRESKRRSRAAIKAFAYVLAGIPLESHYGVQRRIVEDETR